MRTVGYRFSLFVSLVALAGLAGCVEDSNRVLIIGKDAGGQEKVFSLSETAFQRGMASTMERVHRSTLKTIDAQTQDPSLELSRITIGLELEAEVGIDNILELAAEGAFELRFQRLPYPTL
jgi:hypothetical protein